MEVIGLVEGVNSTIGGVTYDARALFCSLLCRWDSNATEPSYTQIMPSQLFLSEHADLRTT